MRIAALALMSVLTLAACSPKAPEGTANAPANPGGVAGNLFPNLFQASYRAETTVLRENGDTIPMVIVRSGQNVRMEITSPQGPMVIVQNGETHQGFTLMNMGGRQIAMTMDTSGADNPLAQDPLQAWARQEGVQLTRGGPCTAAGEVGAEWSSTRPDPTSGNPVTNTACVTGDGIILQAKSNGRVTWQATRIQRGPQDPTQFQLPPGVQVMNLGNAGALLQHGARRP